MVRSLETAALVLSAHPLLHQGLLRTHDCLVLLIIGLNQ